MRQMGQGCGSNPQVPSSEIAAVTFCWFRSSFVSPSGFRHKEVVAMKNKQLQIKLSVSVPSLFGWVAAVIRGWGYGSGSSPSA